MRKGVSDRSCRPDRRWAQSCAPELRVSATRRLELRAARPGPRKSPSQAIYLAKLSERMMLARFTHIANKRHLIPPEQVEFRHGWCLEDNSVYGGRGLRKVNVTRWMASTGAQHMPSSPRPQSPRQSPTLVIRTCRYYDTSEGSCVSAALRRSGGSVCR